MNSLWMSKYSKTVVVVLLYCLSIFGFADRVHAFNQADADSVSISSRPGSDFGRTDGLPVIILNYCINFSTSDSGLSFYVEVEDSSGYRPPYGNAYQSGTAFVDDASYAAGATASKRLCMSTGLEYSKTYSVNVYGISGPSSTYGSWGNATHALLGRIRHATSSAPASTPTNATTIVPSLTPTTPPQSGGNTTSTATTQPPPIAGSKTVSTQPRSISTTTAVDAIEDNGQSDDDFADIGVSLRSGKFDMRISSSFPETKMMLRAFKKGSKSIIWNMTTNANGSYRILTTRALKGFTLSLWIYGDKWDSLTVR
jgi:hypothetical protein